MSSGTNHLIPFIGGRTSKGIRYKELHVEGNLRTREENPNPATDKLILIGGPVFHEAVVAKTVVALAAYTQAGTGVGATLTADANGVMPDIDNATVLATERILVDSEGSADDADNGVYVVTDIGSAGTPWILTRAADWNENTEITKGNSVFVTRGDTYANTTWEQSTDGDMTIDTTDQVFVQTGAVAEVTGSNQGVGGVGVFDTKTGNDLQFRNINAGSAAVTVTLDAGNKEIDLDVDETQLNHNTLQNLATGDVHTQYVHKTGRAGGQTVIGGTAASNILNLQSTSNATKGHVRIPETTSSTNTATGALQVVGGVAIGENLNVGGTFTVTGAITSTAGTYNGINLAALEADLDAFPNGLQSLTTAEVTQLQNIGTNVITNSNWALVSALNQNVASGQNVTFGTVTGTVGTASQPNIDHGSLLTASLLDDDHTQYSLLDGRAGGQTLIGGTAASDYLYLSSTSSATKGTVRVLDTTDSSSGSTGAFTVLGGVGIAKKLYVGTNASVGGSLTVAGTVTGSNITSLQAEVDALPDELQNLTAAEVTQLENIGTSTIDAARWTALSNMGVANGLTQLNGSAKLPASTIPFGTSKNTVLEGDYTPPGRGTYTQAGNSNVITPFAIAGFAPSSGAYTVHVTPTTAGPSAIFHISKSTAVGNDGSVTRTVSYSDGTVADTEINMQWVNGSGPELYHVNPGTAGTITYNIVTYN